MSPSKHCSMGVMLFLPSMKRWNHLLPLLFHVAPWLRQQWIVGRFHRDMWWLICCAFKPSTKRYAHMHQAALRICVCFAAFTAACSAPPAHELMHGSVSICLHAHFSVCSPLDLVAPPPLFFHALNAILRVTFQKPWRAALLSVCARLCDSVWVEKA